MRDALALDRILMPVRIVDFGHPPPDHPHRERGLLDRLAKAARIFAQLFHHRGIADRQLAFPVSRFGLHHQRLCIDDPAFLRFGVGVDIGHGDR